MKLKQKKTGHFILVIILFCLFVKIMHASPPSGSDQWYISGRTGTAWLQNEVAWDFSILDKEFTNHPGLALDLGLGRTFGKYWEPGIVFSVYRLTGENDQPNFSANGIHNSFINLYQAPVEYVSVSTSVSAYCRYHIREFSKKSSQQLRLDPYVEIGGGVNYFFTEVGYKTVPEGASSSVIFRKGTSNATGTKPGNVAQISIGIGTKIEFPGNNLNMIFSFNADMINYDCLDAVHNYNENGERTHANGIVPKILVGVVVPITNKYNSSDSHNPWVP